MIVTLRCLLLLRTISTVTVASPGAMAGIVSALLEPYRGHSFIPWAALDFLAAPSAASGLQRDLGLPVIMLGLSTMLPVGCADPHPCLARPHCLCCLRPTPEWIISPILRFLMQDFIFCLQWPFYN